MFGGHFYHQRVRRAVAVFGSLFNNINVIRKNSSGEVISQVKVPLSYAPKRSFIERIQQMTSGENRERQLSVKLPRMSFEVVSLQYDGIRQLPKTNRRTMPLTGSNTGQDDRTKLYTSTPYNIQFQLGIYAKSQDDALQIVEQIVPYFSPQYTVTMYPLEDLPDVKDDIPITLTSIDFSDDYDGPLEQRRTIIYTLDFEMKVSFYGPIVTRPIIREVSGEIFDIDRGLNDSDILIESLITIPSPVGVGPDSDYTINTEIYGALDSV